MKKTLVAGISIVAFAHGAAHGQTSILTQTGNNNVAVVDNLEPGNQDDVSTIVQNGDENQAIVFQRGTNHQSQIQQFGNLNAIVHRQYEGDFGYAETRQGARNGGSDDNISVIRQIGFDNQGTVLQDGFDNSSTINQGVAVVDQAIDPRSTLRNLASVDQIGTQLVSTIEQRAASGGDFSASDNRADVSQRGRFGIASATNQQSTIVQESRGNFAELFQFEGDSAAPNVSSITQRDSTALVNDLSSNSASTAQRGSGNQGTIVQDGRSNIADISMLQGASAAAPGGGNRTTIDQVGTSLTARTVAGGSRNVQDTGQTGTSSTAFVWQKFNSSDNNILLRQGRGSANQLVNGTAPTPLATSNALAVITQDGSLNSASVAQDGVSLSATVEQYGSGIADTLGATGTSGTFRNLATIEQTGLSHIARAFQAATVTASGGTGDNPAGPASGVGETFGFAGGRRSAELTILQSNARNTAEIYQYGSGQVARIEQSGTDGQATIMQNADATNATAVIQQLGTGNIYSINQSMAGAYIHVRQTGNGNEATTVVQSPIVP